MSGAYYNEHNKKAVVWLRQLIKNSMIADGEVDERSILDVRPDLKGFTQHHFFAGIGGWSYALRLAGWADDRPVCTASLPCQPFSEVGLKKGKDDERHLLPHFIKLVNPCNFKTIFGEQVPAAIRLGWLDDLYLEMERENYAVGSIVLTAAGEGAPHLRQRIYWVADKINKFDDDGWVVYTNHMGHTDNTSPTKHVQSVAPDAKIPLKSSGASGRNNATGVSGFNDGCSEWDNPDWIYTLDNKCRAVKPGIPKMVDGFPRGMGYMCNPSDEIDVNNTHEARDIRIHGYGNAIVPQVAARFIKVTSQFILT